MNCMNYSWVYVPFIEIRNNLHRRHIRNRDKFVFENTMKVNYQFGHNVCDAVVWMGNFENILENHLESSKVQNSETQVTYRTPLLNFEEAPMLNQMIPLPDQIQCSNLMKRFDAWKSDIFKGN